MISVDIDQIYGTLMFGVGIWYNYYYNSLSFLDDTAFLPREIYNITSISHFIITGATQKLIISNRIINLCNITHLAIKNSKNTIISRKILNLEIVFLDLEQYI